jgi:HAE1 family hydrophobic/amphiphilic exporter-1
VATALSLFVVPSFYVLMKQLEAAWFPASRETVVLSGDRTPETTP